MSEQTGLRAMGFVDPQPAEQAVVPAPERRREGRSRAAAGAEAPPSFEAGMAELERIVRELEGGELPLDASLALYERGVALVRSCGQQLDAAQARVSVLATDADGKAVLRPLEAPAP